MKITNVRVRQLEGTMQYSGTFFEERRRNPIDIYPRFKAQGPSVVSEVSSAGSGGYKIKHNFVQIDTDEGVSGMAGPFVTDAPAFYIDTQIKPLLIGQDPITIELLWDQMYRNAVNGRKGDNMIAISHVDVACWDIKGKWLSQPVYRLLGGPVQDKIPVYASASGCSLEPDKVTQRVKEFVQRGYCGTKWFFREGPTDGPDGVRKNVRLMKTIREAAGEDIEIMIDVWNSWDVPYTIKMANLLAEYRLLWIEEPVLPDLSHSYAKIRANSPVALAGGEHEYTRWGAKMLFDMGAIDYYQPDPMWTGGITEVCKILALASAYDIKVILHGYLVPVNAHISFAQNAALTPMMEYLVIRNEATQFFLKNPMKPVDGFFEPPTHPGVGLDLDESKIEAEHDIHWHP